MVIAFNYLTELLTALRLARQTAVVQFFNSLMFAGFSVLLLFAWQREAPRWSRPMAWPACCKSSACCGFYAAGVQSCSPPSDRGARAPRARRSADFWPRLLPFAAWVWVTNLLYNLFDVVDRYMIVHTSTRRRSAGRRRLLSQLAHRAAACWFRSPALLGTMILPHLSHDWEAGRRTRSFGPDESDAQAIGLAAVRRLDRHSAGRAVSFDVAFDGKFAGGTNVLPWTLTYCCWFGMVTMAK